MKNITKQNKNMDVVAFVPYTLSPAAFVLSIPSITILEWHQAEYDDEVTEVHFRVPDEATLHQAVKDKLILSWKPRDYYRLSSTSRRRGKV
jgi:hypothetical protein